MKSESQGRPASQEVGLSVPATVALGLVSSTATGFVLGKLTEGALKSQIGTIDHRTTRVIKRAAGPGTDQIMALMSGAGEPRTLYPIASLVALRWLAQNRKGDSAALASAILGSAALDGVLKRAVQRPRPIPILRRQRASGSSLPSSHIVMSLATYGLLTHVLVRKWRGRRNRGKRLALWALTMLLAVLVSWSRIYQGVHRGSDMVVGWLVGGIWLGTCIRLADRWARDERPENVDW